MNQRVLGRTKWNVSEVGFGAWGIGKSWWGKTDDQESLAALKLAWELGINFFDTAYVYGDGHSETLIGQALTKTPAIIATKIPPMNHEWPANPRMLLKDVFPAHWISSCTERSLKNLQRETLDLTQFHVWTDAWLKNDEWKEAVSRLKSQGKIRAFGVSINDHDPDSALELVQSGLIDTVQVIFNIFDQSPLKKLFPLCEQHNVGVIVRVPFDEGSLTGSFTPTTVFDEGDFRARYFAGEKLAKTLERVEKLRQFIGNGTKSLADLALKFALSPKAVSVVIPGMRKEKHVRANVEGVAGAPLSSRVIGALEKHAWPRNFY